jgi:hypothetical protein
MLLGPSKALARRTLRQRLNRPVVVNPFPATDLSERRNAAIAAWVAQIFELYGIDPASPERWERGFWHLASDLFPNFATIGKSSVGNPGTKDKVRELFYKFQAYRPDKQGSKYKCFLADHRAACRACNIKTADTLKGAMLRMRHERDRDRRNTELLTRIESMKALGLV